MFLTRSIRRKLAFGLLVVLGMLMLLSGSGLWGLNSYRELVNDPLIDDHGFSEADVTRAVARLRWTLPQNDGRIVTTFRREELLQRLQTARDACVVYQTRLDELPESMRVEQPERWQMIGQIQERLDRVAGWLNGTATIDTSDVVPRQPIDPSRPDAANAALDALRFEVDRLEFAAAELPELPDTLRHRLREARHDYRSALAGVLVCSGLVLLSLILLVRFGIRHVLRPIQELQQGARRVARGEFDARIVLDSDDEMGQLAEAFNRMTQRFQETAAGLDKQVQERSRQLVRSERLANVGVLAAGVAHEVNNPLAAVCWAAESLESRLADLLKDAPDDDAAVVQRYVAMIQSESDRCQQITKRLLDFSRDHDSIKTEQDINTIVHEVLSLITHLKKYGTSTVRYNAKDACRLEICGPEIKQVILNLVSNGLDSTGGSGRLDVTLTEQLDWIELRFTDNGCGMEADTIERLFEPFYTTKPTGEGTGLGLAISHRIVEEHGGSLEAISEGAGQGSTFILRLPRTQGRSVEAETQAAEELVRAIAVR